MKSEKITAVILTMMAITLGVSGFQWWKSRVLAASTRALEQTNAGCETQITKARSRLREQEVASEREKVAAARLVKPGASKSAISQASPSLDAKGFSDDGLRRMAAYHEKEKDRTDTQIRIAADRRVNFRSSYALLFRQLGLSVQDQEAFLDLAVDRYERQNDVNAVAYQKKMDLVDLSVVRYREQIEEEYRTGVQSLLGGDKFRLWQAYEQQLPIRDMVAGFVGGAVAGGVALSSDQAERLVQAIVRAAPMKPDAKVYSLWDIDWSGVEAEAVKFLTTEQLNLLNTTDPQSGTGYQTRFGQRVDQIINEARNRDRAAKSAGKK